MVDLTMRFKAGNGDGEFERPDHRCCQFDIRKHEFYFVGIDYSCIIILEYICVLVFERSLIII